jgi:hypothetical protein
MVADCIIYHPTYTKLTKFLDSTPKREKSFRLVAYLSRFLAYYLQRQGYSKEAVQTFVDLKAHATFIRKGMRFLKPLNHLEAAGKLYDNKNIQFRWANIIRNLALSGYLVLDSVSWFKMMGLINKTKFPTVGTNATRFWLLGLIAGVVNGLQNIYSYRQYKASVNKTGDEKVDIDAVNAKLYSAKRKLIWDLLDMFIALNLLGYLHFTEGDIGLAGTITSILGLTDLWRAT